MNDGSASTPSSAQIHPATHANRVIRDVRHAAIDSTACLVLFVLASRLNADGEAWPSYEQLAGDCRLDRRTVVGVVSFLREVGVLVVDTKRGRTANVYSIDLCRLTSLPPDIKPRRSRQPGSTSTDTVVEDHGSTVVHDLGSCVATVIVDPSTVIDDHINRDRGSSQPGSTITRRDKEAVIEQPKEATIARAHPRADEPCLPVGPSSREPPSQPAEPSMPTQAPSSAPKAQDGQLAAQQGASTGLPRRPPDPKRAWHGQPDHEEVNDSKQLPKKTAGSEIVTDTVPASPDELAAILRGYPMLASVANDRRRVENLHSTVMNKALLVRHVRQACEDLCAKRAGSAVGWDVGRLADEIGLFLSNAKQRATKVGVTSEETAALIEIFDELWSKHHGGKPRGCDAGDEEHAGKLIELARKGTTKCGVPPRDVARHVIRQYLNDHDRFLEDNLHPLRLLPGRASSYELPKPQAEKKAGVVPARPPTEAELEASKQAARECFRVVMGGKA